MSEMARHTFPVVAVGHPGKADQTATTTAVPGRLTQAELKLGVRPDDVAQLLQHPLLGDALAPPQAVVSIYFDTPARKLQKAGLSLEIQRIGNRYMQRIREFPAGTDSRLPFSYSEWQHDIDRNEPDPSFFVGTPLDGMIGADEIVSVFEIRIERHAFCVRKDDYDTDVSIDQGEIAAGDRRQRLCEIKIRSRAGNRRGVFDIALSLCPTIPLFLMIESRPERGFDLADGREALVGKGKACATPFTTDLSAKSAFQLVGLECLRHLSVNIPTLLDASDEYALHQMRVAIRRFRVAMSLFKEMLQDSESRGVKAELKKVADLFGEARNLEVFAADVARLNADNPQEPGLRALGALLDARKEEAYRLARLAVLSPGFPCALIRIARWLATGIWANESSPRRGSYEQPIAELAKTEMTRRRKVIKRLARDFDRLDAAALHRLRIEVKKLRYASEFFDALFRHRKRKKAFLSSVVGLQTDLGELNDLAVQHKLVLALLSDRPGLHGDDIGFAAGFVRGLQVARAGRLRKSAESACSRVLSVRPFWAGAS